MDFIYYSKAGQSFTRVYDTGTDQEAILVPPGCSCVVTLAFDAPGAATLKASNYPHDMIKADSAEFEEWDKGEVTALASGKATGISAIQVVRSSGTPRVVVTLLDVTAGLN